MSLIAEKYDFENYSKLVTIRKFYNYLKIGDDDDDCLQLKERE